MSFDNQTITFVAFCVCNLVFGYSQEVGVTESTASTSGSDLTMGTSVTFAGNPVVAMRRMREESSSPQKESNVITDTLDFGRNLESKSLEEVKADLKNWNLEDAVAKLRKDSMRHKGSRAVHIRADMLNALGNDFCELSCSPALMMARPGTAAPKRMSFFEKVSQHLMVTLKVSQNMVVTSIHLLQR